MKFTKQKLGRLGGAKALAVAAFVTSLIGAGISSGVNSASASAKLNPLVVGGILPFTGTLAQVGVWGTHGVGVGIYEVNHAGGVLGHQLKSSYVDDAADSVDAVPAFRKLMLSHPTVVVGPFSPTIEAVISQFQPSNVVDFTLGGLTTLDNMNKPYVFRVTASDTTMSLAMAQYAISKGWKTASLIFDNSANGQALSSAIALAYKALGGTIQQSVTFTPGQASYSAELTQTYLGKPKVVFGTMDAPTAATMWTDGQQLGYMTTPWIGDDLESGVPYAQAFGPTASADLTGTVTATPSGAAYAHFLVDYKKLYHSSQPLSYTYNMYDAVVIASLAMTMAKSTNPRVWKNDVTKVSNPPGIKCYAYASCVNLLKHGKKINYEGAGGSDDFNTHHNVFSGFEMVGFDSSLNSVTKAYISPAQLAAVAAKEG